MASFDLPDIFQSNDLPDLDIASLDMQTPKKVKNVDANIRALAQNTPEEDAYFTKQANHPDVLKSNLAEIEDQIANTKRIRPQDKADLIAIRDQLKAKVGGLGTSSSDFLPDIFATGSASVPGTNTDTIKHKPFESGAAFAETKKLIPSLDDVNGLIDRFKREWANRHNTPFTQADADRLSKEEGALRSGVGDVVGGIPAMIGGALHGLYSGVKNLDATQGYQQALETTTNLLPSSLLGNKEDQQSKSYHSLMAPFTALTDVVNAVPQGYGEILNSVGLPGAAAQVSDGGKLAALAAIGAKGGHDIVRAVKPKAKPIIETVSEPIKVPQKQLELPDLDIPQDGPIRPTDGFVASPRREFIPPKLNDAIGEARLELSKPDLNRAKEAFAKLDEEINTPKVNQNQTQFDFGAEVNPKVEPTYKPVLGETPSILTREIVAKDGNNYVLNYHTKDGVVQVRDVEGKVVAEGATSSNRGAPADVALVNVKPEFRRLGLSTAIHDFFEANHKGGLKKSETLTPDGEAFWNSRNEGKKNSYETVFDTEHLSPYAARLAQEKYLSEPRLEGMEPISNRGLDVSEVTDPISPQYTKQQELHINPLDALISEAQKRSEPKAIKTKPVEPEPTPIAPSKGEQLGFDSLEPSFEKGVNQSNVILDTASKEIYPDGLPSKEKLESQPDLPIVADPKTVLDTFGITDKNVKPLNGLTGLNSPLHKRRELWANNPVLRSAFDSIKEIADRTKRTITDSLGFGTVDKYSAAISKLTDAEKIEAARAKVKYDEVVSNEMRDNGRVAFTEKEWIDLGVSPKVAKILVEGDVFHSAALKLANETETQAGRAPVEAIPNYLSHQHGHPFRVTIFDKASGQTQTRSVSSRKLAKQIAEDLNAQGLTADYSRVSRDKTSMGDALEILREKRNSATSERASNFSKLIDSVIAKRDRAFLGSLKDRNNTGGYTGDHGFPETTNKKVLAEQLKDAEFILGLPEKAINDTIRYSTESRIKAYTDSLREAGLDKGLAHTGAWQQLLDTVSKHADSYLDESFDFSKRNVVEHVMDVVSAFGDSSSIPGHTKVPAISPHAVLDVVKGFGRIALATKISPVANLALMPVQYLQFALSPINVANGSLRFIARNEGKIPSLTKEAIALGKSPIDVTVSSIKALKDTVNYQFDRKLDPTTFAALEWANNGGHFNTFLHHEHLDFKSRISRALTAQKLSEHAEYTPRTIAFLSQYFTAKNLGFSEGAARRSAINGMNEIMGDYSKESKPAVIRNLDPVTGTVISQLSTFLLNTTAQLHSLTTGSGSGGKILKGVLLPLATYLGASYLATGWKGLPGVNDYDTAVQAINDKFKADLPTSYEIKLRSGHIFGDYANDAYYGKLSELTGSDVAKSARAGSMFSYGTFAPSMAAATASSAYNESKNLLSKLGVGNAPSDDALYKSRKAILPPNFGYLAEDAFGTKNSRGNIITPEGIEKDHTVNRSVFEPLAEKKQRDERSNINYRKAHELALSKSIMERITDKANRKESIVDDVKKLVELNPDFAQNPSLIEDAILRNQEKRRLNVIEREIFNAIKGESLNKLQDAKHAIMVKKLSERK